MVKCFLELVKVVDRKYVFQDVDLTHFEQGRDAAKNADVWVKLLSEAGQSWLKNNYSPARECSLIIINTEGWKNRDTNNEFGVEVIKSYEHLQMRLEGAGFNRTLSVITVVVKVCNYTVMYLLPEKAKYCVF